MSGINVRRLTATVVFAALPGLAVPAAAVPSWSISSGSHELGLMDQVVAWSAHLWWGKEPQRGPVEKLKAPGTAPEAESDRSNALDPNGGC